MINKNNIPQHIAIIMDGNGRWAKKKGLPKIEGHRAGVRSVEEVIKACLEIGVKVLSLYTFSTENWQRSKREVSALMRLLEQYLKNYTVKLDKNGIRLVICGEMGALADSLQRQLELSQRKTQANSKLTLNLALNYGSREEITHAAGALAEKIKSGEMTAEEINPAAFERFLYTKDLPDPELIIRTSGEQRLSNFFLWQASYSELYFTPTLWPDFRKADLEQAISDYQKRERRFGA
ncbi:MAG: isoprenyl transferase [Candidatus Omnitrophota bacterium]